MNAWLEPSIIATLSITMVMFASFCFLYNQEHELSLKYFSVAWLIYSTRFIARLVNLHYPIPITAELVNYFSNILNSGVLVIGVLSLFKRLKNRAVPLLILISAVLVALLYLLKLNPVAKTTIIFLITGSSFIYIGFTFLILAYRNSIYIILGIDFILWGLHKYDYPFLYNSETFAPLGYLLAVLFSIIAAQGFHILYYQTARNELQREKESLTSLLDIIRIDDVEQLLDEALAIALKDTQSEYGYIYHYSETEKEFRLNTWSNGVHNDCRVTEKQTVYKLDATGCWGEAVRQRKPFMLNDYRTDNSFRKGTPEGHVKIRKFLTVPFFSGSDIVAVIGVANKRDNYTEDDIRQLSLLMNNVWKIVEVKEFQEQLKIAKKQAEESSSIKSAFLANISHELRTPLNGTLGMLALVKGNYDPEKSSRYLDMAYKSSEDMLYLVEDILSFSQYNNKQLKMVETEFDLVEDLKTLVELNKPAAEENGLSLELDCQMPILKISTDKIKFNQILVNLINNAIKFSEQGQIKITVTQSDRLDISISDQGIGIPDDKLELIFEPFYQLEDPYTKTHKGIGAGLAIVKSLCELLGIGINITSEPGKGTDVSLSIDLTKNA